MKDALLWCAGLVTVIFLVIYVGGAVISAQPRVWATDGVIEDVPAGTPSSDLELTIRFQPSREGWGPSGGLLPEGYERGNMPTLRAEVRAVGRGSTGVLTPECTSGYRRTDREPGDAVHLRDRLPTCEWTVRVRVYNHTAQIQVRILHHRYSGWEPVLERTHSILGPEGGLFDRGRLDRARADQHRGGGRLRGFYWIRAEDIHPN